jgi:hypothetical protein
MAADVGKSVAITNLDTQPILRPTTGMGAVGRIFTVLDIVAATAVGLGTAKSSYRLCRFPTKAIPLTFELATDVALDTGTHALAFDINIAFSDSVYDGTPPALQGLIPTSANTGATTTLAAYSSPNVLFGSSNNTSASVALGFTNYTLAGSRTNYPIVAAGCFLNQPLYETFGFVDGRGNSADPGGWFDIYLVNATVAGTGAAGNIIGRLSYII